MNFDWIHICEWKRKEMNGPKNVLRVMGVCTFGHIKCQKPAATKPLKTVAYKFHPDGQSIVYLMFFII